MNTHALMVAQLDMALFDSGLSQAEFCRRVGTSTKHLNMVLQGHARASFPTLDYWAQQLGYEFQVTLVPARQSRRKKAA